MSQTASLTIVDDEAIPPGEADDLRVITEISLEILDTKRRPVRRGQHPKHHGCVRAEFTVLPDVPEELRVGLFGEPRTYPAWVRFSNGSQDDDAKGDIHGMAIKLMDVDGPKILEGEEHERTQDFVLMDHPVFFSRDARSNRGLAEVIRRAIGQALLPRPIYVAIHHFLFGLRFHEFGVLRAATSKKPKSPLSIVYWSATPYRLGPLAVKYSARPLPAEGVPEPTDMTSPNRLRDAMKAHLARAEARFDFTVQVRAPGNSMPVEDASVEWQADEAPFRAVATLVIPPQEFDSPGQMEFCENLSYTPWHSRAEHRPIGGINRARKVVYDAVSRRRHELNQAPRREPEP